MCELSSINRSISNSETLWTDRNITENSTRKELYFNLIKKANSVPIIKLFKYYGLALNEYNHKTICPFSFHQGGHERSPSFYFYPKTNGFWCFGCKTGSQCCDLVANLDKISKVEAALKIINLFNDDVDEDAILVDRNDFTEKLKIMLDFSDTVREFRKNNIKAEGYIFIENICQVYDAINLKHNFDNKALRSVVEQLKEKINCYEMSVL